MRKHDHAVGDCGHLEWLSESEQRRRIDDHEIVNRYRLGYDLLNDFADAVGRLEGRFPGHQNVQVGMILVLLQQSVPIYARGDRVPQPFLVCKPKYMCTPGRRRSASISSVLRFCWLFASAGRLRRSSCPPGALRM